MSRPKVFVSYSHSDKRWKDRLLQFFQALEREIIAWSDDQINVGDNWLEEIERELEDADAAVAIVSIDFINSEFVRNVELARLLDRRKGEGLKIFPIIIGWCPWEKISWLQATQARPEGKPVADRRPADRDKVFTNFAVEIVEQMSGSLKDERPTGRQSRRVDRASRRMDQSPAARQSSLKSGDIETTLRENPQLARELHNLTSKILQSERVIGAQHGVDSTRLDERKRMARR